MDSYTGSGVFIRIYSNLIISDYFFKLNYKQLVILKNQKMYLKKERCTSFVNIQTFLSSYFIANLSLVREGRPGRS